MSSLLYVATFAGVAFCLCAFMADAAPIERGTASTENARTVYGFTVKDINGQDVKLARYRGDVMLIVNVASR